MHGVICKRCYNALFAGGNFHFICLSSCYTFILHEYLVVTPTYGLLKCLLYKALFSKFAMRFLKTNAH